MTVVRAACRCTLPVLLFARWLGGTVILAPLTIDRLMLAHLQVSLYYLQNDLINGFIPRYVTVRAPLSLPPFRSHTFDLA